MKSRIVLLVVAAFFAALGCMADPVTKTRLGSLNPREGLVVTDIDLSAIGGDHVQEIARFAATGTVFRASSYGTQTRWVDATGCVWEVVDYGGDWRVAYNSVGVEFVAIPVWREPPDETVPGWYAYGLETGYQLASTDYNATLTDIKGYSGGVYDDVSGEVVCYTGDVSWMRGVQTIFVGRVAMTNEIPDVSGYTTQQQATNAATAVADAKISTNNAAFVSAVLAVPLTGADAGDIAEIAEYGSYGTVGAALLALIAGLAALKRRVGTAETALAQKASLTDLPYALVEPGVWEFSGVPEGHTITEGPYFQDGDGWIIVLDDATPYYSDEMSESAMSLTWHYDADGATITATRASLPGHLLDRAGNRVVVSGDTTLTLPAANPGYIRDFLVRLEISGSTVPTITFAAPTGETITYETDGNEFPVPDDAGDWLFSFTEGCVAHKFAVSLKKVNTVAAPQAQGGS